MCSSHLNSFPEEAAKALAEHQPFEFFDTNTGASLFTIGGSKKGARPWKLFAHESRKHGWPSFRTNEVNWSNVRILPNGEVVSTTGTHLGHNLPDKSGNRFCINLVAIAGRAT